MRGEQSAAGRGAPALAHLDAEQQRAVVAPPGPVCVLAGAGTGKTRTITHRIAHLIGTGAHPAREILAVTFTTRAAGEMRTRLRSMGAGAVQARTFHSAALRQLKYFWPRSIGGDMWSVMEHKMRLVAGVARRAGAKTDTATLRDLASEIEWAKACLIAPQDYAAAAAELARDTPMDAAVVAGIYADYEQEKANARQLDFDDLLLHTCAILENDEDAARTFRAQYRSFVVDEFQDVTPLQHRLLDAWLGGRDDVTVVGDANQTIYSFAGATPRYLLDFERRYPHASVVRLERDYRSTTQVVDVANRVIAGARGRSAQLKLRLRAVTGDGPAVRYQEYDDEPAEAAGTATAIAALIADGADPSSIAVLYRINAQSEVYEQALAAEKVPYVVRGGERFFARPEVRQALSVLAQAAARVEGDGPGDPQAVGAGPGDPRAVGRSLVATVRATLEPLGLTATPPPPGAVRERWDALSALVSVAEDVVAADGQAGLSQFVGELRQRAELQHAPTVSGVTLASLHAAKGLEWDTVFLVGLSDGTVPIQHADSDEEIEEERRLLYVGVTRARSRLVMSWSLARAAGGRRSRRPSRFLDGIAPQPQRATSGKRPSRASRCHRCGSLLSTPAEIKRGRCGRCPSSIDPELLADLKAWRKETAAEASVPAFVVFSDATLVAIAERQPRSEPELLSIPGIGRSKLEHYGPTVLRLVRERPEGQAQVTGDE